MNKLMNKMLAVLPCPKKYVVQKQTTKQIITCLAQQKICSPKTDQETNNHLPWLTKKYVVRKQTWKQIITCRAQPKNMQSENRLRNK